jgi:adenylate cyclase
VLARRAWAASGGRWTVLAELGLAALQVADWLGPSGRGLGDGSKVAVLFTDLVGYSDWAVRAGDEESLEVLRRVDARVTDAVTEAGGAVVKRLGDGTMAVFPDATPALEAARKALEVAPEAKVDGYDPTLRAGLHFGSPQPIGSDFIGVDVNIAARLCQAAGPNEILMTETIATLAGDRVPVEPRDPGRLPGVPRGMRLYGLCDGPG